MMAIVIGLSLIMKGNKKGSRAFIILSVIAMFCVMGLREATLIGIDSASSYLHTFERISEMSWAEFRQAYRGLTNPALFRLMRIVSNLSGGSYQAFVIVMSAFIMICFGHFVNRYSVSPIQSFCYYWGLLLYVFMFSAEKQAMAMAILLLAFDGIMEKRPVKFTLLVLLAALFHFPALIFLPAYWLSKIRINRNYLLILAIVLLLTYLFRDGILRLMLLAYGGEEIEATMSGMVLLRTKSIVMIGITIAAIILRVPEEEDRLYSILLKFVGVAIVFQTFCAYNNIFERLADYYFQFSVVFIPLVFEKKDDVRSLIDARTASFAKSVAPYVFSAYGVYRFAGYVAADAFLTPYVFFFNK